jgi:hypothetical protein
VLGVCVMTLCIGARFAGTVDYQWSPSNPRG